MMEKQDQQMHIIRQKFDSILIKHMQRLLGARLGVGGLPLNLLTVSCLIFLAEQHANEQENFSTPEERYTHATLLKELEEVGLGSNAALKEVLREMHQKEYVHIADSGFISTKEPVLKMTQLIDKILPKMPGLNLVAYIAQTIDEAVSGRKEIDSAVVQFDQTLTLQGLPIKKDAGKPISTLPEKKIDKKKHTPQSSIQRGQRDHKKTSKGNLLTATDYERPYRTISESKTVPEKSNGPRILSSSGEIAKSDIQAIAFGAAPPIQDEPDRDSRATDDDANPQVLNPSVKEIEDESIEIPVAEDTVSTQADASKTLTDQESHTQFQEKEHSEEMVSPDEESESETSIRESDVSASRTEALIPEQLKSADAGVLSPDREVEDKIDLETDDPPQNDHDDIIESRINSFEETLAMQCPICNNGKIIPEKTMKDKTYYKCPNKACNFISWGKPHHHVCPRCKNPFLIESKKNGETVLKCPRSTCHYWQGDLKDNTNAVSAVQKVSGTTGKPKKRRRVVKRRVVRKKR